MVIIIQLNERQEKIIKIVKERGPITGEQIAEKLNVTRPSLRPDLAFLTQIGLLEARPRVGYFYSGRTPNYGVIEQIMKLRVKDYKSVPVVVTEKTSVYDSIVALFVNDVGTLFVVSEQGILEGVVSRKDLLKTALGKIDVNQLPVGVIMTRMPNIITTTPEESLWSAARKLITHEIDALPVVRKVSQHGGEKIEVIGRISKTNITKVFVDLGLGRLDILGGKND
ncbi:MAG: DeoR family transcriptional regulator, catabolite repression regulator [Clostridia bacterium]|nr:DeoR family transcriptional regulator, catabolite repression regulator [Clostridia bacterium]